MEHAPFNVLFLCTGNSARSIMAEALLNYTGKGKFHAFSAGSQPAGHINPLVLELLNQQKLPTADLRSKSWDEFATTDAPKMDFVFTVCNNAAGEVCPVWPGQPMTAHWGIDDPNRVTGSDTAQREAISAAYRQLSRRISLFISLLFDKLDAMSLKHHLDNIGRS